jgi:hypothetical protein
MLLVAAAACVAVACSSEDTVAAGLNGACTRSKDCLVGLTCAGGVCTPLDAGTDGGPPEGGDRGDQ